MSVNSSSSSFLISATDGSTSQVEADEAGGDTAVYEAQYFGFTPKSFYNGIYNAVSEYIFEALAALEKCIGEDCADIMPQSDIKEATSRLQPRVEKTINRAFDKIEVYLDENIFNIPCHVVLPEDKIQQCQPVSREEMQTLEKQIDELKDKILAVKYANTCIAYDIRLADQAQAKMSQTFKDMKAVKTIVRTAGISDFRDSLIHCVGQTKTLMNNVTDMQAVSSHINSQISSEPLPQKCKTNFI